MIAQYLDLSIGHLTDEAQMKMQAYEGDYGTHGPTMGWPAMSIAEYLAGWFVTVPDFGRPEVRAQAQHLPGDLYHVLRYAYSLGCAVVRFDIAGDALHSLHHYGD